MKPSNLEQLKNFKSNTETNKQNNLTNCILKETPNAKYKHSHWKVFSTFLIKTLITNYFKTKYSI